jgi:CheY-like chemotaxis protein
MFGPKKVILIAEDDEIESQKLTQKLAEIGYEAYVMPNGKEAFAVAHKLKPSLILSDLMMPIMDGFELLDLVKQDPQLKDTPFVFHSVFPLPEYVERAMRNGAADFFVKSEMSTVQMIEKIDMILQDKRSTISSP